MNAPDNGHNESNRFRGIRPETEEKYRQAIELYRTTGLSCVEISRTCKVTVSGFQRCFTMYRQRYLPFNSRNAGNDNQNIDTNGYPEQMYMLRSALLEHL